MPPGTAQQFISLNRSVVVARRVMPGASLQLGAHQAVAVADVKRSAARFTTSKHQQGLLPLANVPLIYTFASLQRGKPLAHATSKHLSPRELTSILVASRGDGLLKLKHVLTLCAHVSRTINFRPNSRSQPLEWVPFLERLAQRLMLVQRHLCGCCCPAA